MSPDEDIPEGPFDEAQLVLYRGDLDDAHGDPTHETLADLGVWCFSLWARYESGAEIPILAESNSYSWYSVHSDTFNTDPAESVSDAFVDAVCDMVDEEAGGEWGEIPEDVWERTTDLERYVIQIIRQGFLMMDCAEPALVIDWCQKRRDGGIDQ